jgi:hypothetical protein
VKASESNRPPGLLLSFAEMLGRLPSAAKQQRAAMQIPATKAILAEQHRDARLFGLPNSG